MKQKNLLGNSPDIQISRNPDSCWIWDILTFSLWFAINLLGKIQILETKWSLERTLKGLKNKTNHDFSIFFGLAVMAFPKNTTVWWLLYLGHSDLFILVGLSFVRKNSNINKKPKGIKWSAVPFALLYFILGFHGGRQGSGTDRGQSPVEWGDFPFFRSFIPLWTI